tara:strand:- start:60 stop:338 length:279 start_codon:yes stop_codon:yes gene_type:complete
MSINENPTNPHDALQDTLAHSRVLVEVFCQVEGEHCKCDVAVWDDSVDGFSPSHILGKLKSKGWIYRHNAENYGPQQWVCPACLADEAGGAS